MGDGGGSGSSTGEDRSSESPEGDDGETGESGSSPVPLSADRELLPDFTDPASDLSTSVSPLLKFEVELRGLSVLFPGILDLKPRKDLVDSFVSALLNEG